MPKLHNPYPHELVARFLKPRYGPDGRRIPGIGTTVGSHRSVEIDADEVAMVPNTGVWEIIADGEPDPVYPEPYVPSEAERNAAAASTFPGRPW
jgi:hypothetical protein